MSSSTSVQMCMNPVSSTGPSSLKTMRLLSSNLLAEQLSTGRAHPVIINSRGLLFQGSNITVLVSNITQPSEFRANCLINSFTLINILVLCPHISLVFILQCLHMSLTPEVILYSNTTGTFGFRVRNGNYI